MVVLFSVLRVAIDALREIISSYRCGSKRIKQSPGLPVPNPTTPFWSIPCRSFNKKARMSGTAFARTLLDMDRSLEVVMSKARDLDLKKHDAEAAKQIIQFRLSHLDELISVAEEQGLTEEDQCRKVDTYDVLFDKDVFERAKEKLPSEKGDSDGLAGRCAGSFRRRAARSRCIQEFCQNCSRRTLHSGCTRTHLVFPSTTISFTRPAAISAPNTSSIRPMVGRTISSSQSGRYRSRAGTGFDDGWLVRGRLCCAQARLRIDGTTSLNNRLILRHLARGLMQNLCLAAASRWAPSLSLTLSDVLMTAKSSFECLHTLVTHPNNGLPHIIEYHPLFYTAHATFAIPATLSRHLPPITSKSLFSLPGFAAPTCTTILACVTAPLLYRHPSSLATNQQESLPPLSLPSRTSVPAWGQHIATEAWKWIMRMVQVLV
ncbi:uncharacterized protein ARMOST_08580 [Armillaria ostoyae]|uniref:Uncharacterized protein n=1 Tax=Armillaria ostoyae TaxID=47428 RepID=A0A284R907_ARMOS|nr:uncharacterized protein ARMOST_08580 [Armillaria ostoyae]